MSRTNEQIAKDVAAKLTSAPYAQINVAIILAALNESNAQLQAENELLDAAIDGKDGEIGTLLARVGALEAENNRLSRIIDAIAAEGGDEGASARFAIERVELQAENTRLREEARAANEMANALANQIGSIDADQPPDEQKPRAETWLQERKNWQAEVVRLRGGVVHLETKCLVASKEIDHLRAALAECKEAGEGIREAWRKAEEDDDMNHAFNRWDKVLDRIAAMGERK